MNKEIRNRKRGRVVLLSLLAVLVLATISLNVGDTKGNGSGTGDGNLNYDCGGSCHVSVDSGTVLMDASTLTPMTSQTITVTVTATESNLGSANLIGVFLVSELSVENSIPSQDDWEILSDPNGGLKNYVEKEASPGVGQEFTWTLRTPTQPGDYELYTRVHHGPAPYFEDNTAGLTFDVSETPSGTPIIDHTPVTKAFTEETIKIEALLKDSNSVNLYWRGDGATDYAMVEMSKVSDEPDGQSKFSAEIPSQSEPCVMEYYINATNGDLFSITPSSRIVVTEEPQIPNLAAWGMQNLIILELVTIVSIIAVKISIKNGKSKNKKGGDESG
jgi:hypothetical protein